MKTTYPHGREFRLKILSLAINPTWWSRFGRSLILPEYFEADDERDIVRAILEFHTRYKRIPRDPEDVLVLCNGKHERTIKDLFTSDFDTSLAEDIVIQWAREQAAKNAILESIEDVKAGNLQAVVERVKTASKVGEEITTPGLDIMDTSLWLSHDTISNKTATGWMHLDNHLGGGLGDGELLTILAPSNRGKSMALANIAYGAAGLGSGKNVVIFTHEMSQNVYAKRFGARLIWRFPKRHEDLKEYELEFQDAAKLLLPGKIRIVGNGKKMTTQEIETVLDRLKDDGFDYDLVIDDYLDLVQPPRKYKERRYELTSLWEWFREALRERHVPGATASQTTRGSYNKEIITETDIAEDIGKVNVSDIVVAVCQTKKEEVQQRCRLYGAKVRDGERGFMFDAKFYPQQQAIITTGVSKRKDDANEEVPQRSVQRQ